VRRVIEVVQNLGRAVRTCQGVCGRRQASAGQATRHQCDNAASVAAQLREYLRTSHNQGHDHRLGQESY
jgi:hypothetical protein